MKRETMKKGGSGFSAVLLVLIISGVLSPALIFGGGTAEDDLAREAAEGETVVITDSTGRTMELPKNPDHIICSGPGALRLITYLRAEEKVIAVDDMEGRRPQFDARPYALANPQFKDLPLFGEFRGFDNPELIAALEPQPRVIFKTFPEMGMNPVELENKTGIPVTAFTYGELAPSGDTLYNTLRTLAVVLDRRERAEEVIAFFEETIADLKRRSSGGSDDGKTCYVGGIAFKGPHGLQSTEPGYPPFLFTNARNAAAPSPGDTTVPEQTDVAKEKIVEWDPDIIFIDTATLQSEPQASALYQLKNDPAYRELTAVKTRQVYGVLPYNWYTQNFGSILADAYFIGKILYPEQFSDIDPVQKADEIYRFLVGEEVFEELDKAFQNKVFKKLL